MPDTSVRKPFAGIRILDFTRYVAGPFGTYQLALLGADVIKIEPKTGDDMRHSQLSREWAAKGLGPSFLGINSNKRSLTLDLTKPQAVADREKTGRRRRCRLGEFSARRHGPLWHWLRDAAGAQPEADLLRRLRLRPERAGARHRRLRRQAAGDVRDHVDHRARGQRPDPRRLRAVRHDRRDDRRLRGRERAIPAQPHRRGAVRRCCDARRGAGVYRAADRRIHRDRPQAPPVRQSVLDRQGHRQPLQGRRGRSDARGDDREAVCQPDDARSGRPDDARRPAFRRLAEPQARTSRHCARSSRGRSPATAQATGKSG